MLFLEVNLKQKEEGDERRKAMKKFHGLFNWSGETYDLWTTAPSEEKAFMSFTSRLSKIVGVSASTVRNRFNGTIDNFWIEKGKEVK